MAFYLIDDLKNKTLISNDYLKKKLLTYSTSPLLEKSDEVLSSSNSDIFYKRINYEIPKYSVDECIDIILEKTSLNIDDISSLLSFEKNSFLSLVYCINQGLLNSEKIREIIAMNGTKSRAEVLLSALESESIGIDNLLFFQLRNFLILNNGKININDFSSEKDIKERIEDISPEPNKNSSTEKSGLSFPMKRGLSEENAFSNLKYLNWVFKLKREFSGRKPQESDYPHAEWWQWITGVIIIAALYDAKQDALYQSALRTYQLKIYEQTLKNKEQEVLSDSFFEALELYKKGKNFSLTDEEIKEFYSKGDYKISYKIKEIYSEFCNILLPELGKAFFANKNQESKGISEEKIDKLLEGLRTSFAFVISNILKNSQTPTGEGETDVSYIVETDIKDTFYPGSNKQNELFIPSFFRILKCIYENSDFENQYFYDTLDFYNGSERRNNLTEERTFYFRDSNFSNYYKLENGKFMELDFAIFYRNNINEINVSENYVRLIDSNGNSTFFKNNGISYDPIEVSCSSKNFFYFLNYTNLESFGEDSNIYKENEKIKEFMSEILSSIFFSNSNAFSGQNPLNINETDFLYEYLKDISPFETIISELFGFSLEIDSSFQVRNIGSFSLIEKLKEIVEEISEGSSLGDFEDSEGISTRKISMNTILSKLRDSISKKIEKTKESPSQKDVFSEGIQYIFLYDLIIDYIKFLMSDNSAGKFYSPSVSEDFYKFYALLSIIKNGLRELPNFFRSAQNKPTDLDITEKLLRGIKGN